MVTEIRTSNNAGNAVKARDAVETAEHTFVYSKYSFMSYGELSKVYGQNGLTKKAELAKEMERLGARSGFTTYSANDSIDKGMVLIGKQPAVRDQDLETFIQLIHDKADVVAEMVSEREGSALRTNANALVAYMHEHERRSEV